MTFGKLYHNGSVCFGPAMNRAYALESELACYPRILIDAPVFNAMTIFKPDGHEIQNEWDALYSFAIGDPINYWWQINYLSNHVLYQNSGDIQCKVLYEVRYHAINELINNAGNDKIAIKYCWFKEYFNRCVKCSANLTDIQKNSLYIKREDLNVNNIRGYDKNF